MADIAGLNSAFGVDAARNRAFAEDDEASSDVSPAEQSIASATDPAAARINEITRPEVVTPGSGSQLQTGDGAASGGRVIEDIVSLSTEAQSRLAADAQGAGTQDTGAQETQQTASNENTPVASAFARSETPVDTSSEVNTNTGVSVVADAGDAAARSIEEQNELDTGETTGNRDTSATGSQNRELGQIVDQFA